MNEQRFRLLTDGDGHDYLVPDGMQAKFEEACRVLGSDDFDNPDYGVLDSLLCEWSAGRSIACLTFTDPQWD